MKKMIRMVGVVLLALSTLQAANNGDSFTLKTVGGKTLHAEGRQNGILFKELKGKIVFLEFWGTHCPPCLMSIPHYIDLMNKYKDKLAVVAIEVQDTPEAYLAEFAKAKKINYDVIAYRNALNFISYVGKRTQWGNSIPFLIIFDQQGNFVTSQVGLLPENALEGVIKQLEKQQNQKAAAPAPESNASKK